nr:M23 family metallopeptidase [Prauserella isguenensis]
MSVAAGVPVTARTSRVTAVVATVVAVLAALVPPTSTVPPGTSGGTGTARHAEPSGASGPGVAGAAGSRAADGRADEVTLAWPLEPRPEVARPFDPPDSEYGPGHRGVDLVAEPGQPVSVAAAGRVVYAGDLAGRGVVSIEHRDGLRTTYEPVSAQVAEGDRVRAGARIGTVARGHDGCPDSACLHWGLRRGEQYLDPLAFVAAAGPLRLKPWPG